MDTLLLLEDDSYEHFEFQSSYSEDDLARFAMYDLQVYHRDKRKIQTIIIYSSDVRKIDNNLHIGSLVYTPINIMMYNYDGNAVYKTLETKLKSGNDITDNDMLNLIFLPLMKWEKKGLSRVALTKQSIKMAQTIPDRRKRDICTAAAFMFSQKYLNETDLNQILEVLKMTDLATMLIEDAVNENTKKVEKETTEKVTVKVEKETKIEMAKEMLLDKKPMEEIKKYTKLTEKEINNIKKPLKLK